MPQCMLHRHWAVSGISNRNVDNVIGTRGRDLSTPDQYMGFFEELLLL